MKVNFSLNYPFLQYYVYVDLIYLCINTVYEKKATILLQQTHSVGIYATVVDRYSANKVDSLISCQWFLELALIA